MIGFELLEPEHPTLYAFTGSIGAEALVVVGNLSWVPREVPLAFAGELMVGNLVIGSYGEIPSVAGALRPWEVRLVRQE